MFAGGGRPPHPAHRGRAIGEVYRRRASQDRRRRPVRHLKAKSVKKIAFALDPEFAGPDFELQLPSSGAILGDYEPDRLKTCDDKKTGRLLRGSGCLGRIGRGRPPRPHSCRGTKLLPGTRQRARQPAAAFQNGCRRTEKMAADYGLVCEVLDQAAMEKLGMGALLGVSQEAPSLRR